MLDFSLGLTALRANQAGLNVVGQNVANANTPDYHRQNVRLVDRSPIELNGLSVGTGVDVASIDRVRTEITEQSITTNIAEQSDIAKRLEVLRQIESHLPFGDDSLNSALGAFFDDLQRLSSDPDHPTFKQTAIQSANTLTRRINSTAGFLNELSARLDQEIAQAVEDVNNKSVELAELNRRIHVDQGRGVTPNDLLDQRDRLVNEMAELIDVQPQEQRNIGTEPPLKQTGFVLGGRALIFTKPVELITSTDQTGNVVVKSSVFGEPLSIEGGELSALLGARNSIVQQYQTELDEFTRGLLATVDQEHAQGVGSTGAFDVLHGRRGVSDVSSPLNKADLANPLHAGNLVVGVTDDTTGIRTLSEIAIDPDVQSMEDIAGAIDGVDHLQATVDEESKTLVVMAETGYGFDFVGGTQLSDTSAVTGTFAPSLSGMPVSRDNEQYVFQIEGTGNIGVTPGLVLNVRDAAGQLVNQFDVGAGYEAGSELSISEGVSISLSIGTANNGDSFSGQVVGRSDEVGILSTLGLNTLFVGTTATDLALNTQITSSPDSLAASRSGQPGDTGNLQNMLALRQESADILGSRTLEEFAADLTSTVGRDVNDLTLIQDNLALVGQALQAERESISGVDPNEELVKMLQYQRGFQSAARYISAVDESLQELIDMLR